MAHESPVQHGLVVLGASLALAAYGLAWLRTSRRSVLRLVGAAVGLSALAVAMTPRVERWAASAFTGHMVQHLLMVVVAAPLLVLARPLETATAVWSPPWSHGTVQGRIAAWWRRAGPLVAPGIFLATMYLTHLTGIYDAALGNRWLHELEHLAYLSTAYALWVVAMAPGRSGSPRRVAAAFGVIGGCALLGMVLLSATRPLVPTYARELGVQAALSDQRTAASLMWVGGMALTLPLLVASVWRWASIEERVAARIETTEPERATAPGSRPGR